MKLQASYITDNKIVAIDDQRAELLYIRGLTFCKQNLTDGFIHKRLIATFAPFTDDVLPKELAAELVRVGLWRAVEDGWVVEAWLDWNPHSSDVMTPSRGRELAHIRHHVNKGIVSDDCALCAESESANSQVTAHVCGPQCGTQCGPQCVDALPETESETDSKTETETENSLALISEDEATAEPVDTDFDKFWKVYPRKARKPLAEKEFRRARRKVPVETLIERATLYADQEKRKRTEAKYICMAHNWLAEERWDDELESVKTGPAAATIITDRDGPVRRIDLKKETQK